MLKPQIQMVLNIEKQVSKNNFKNWERLNYEFEVKKMIVSSLSLKRF